MSVTISTSSLKTDANYNDEIQDELKLQIMKRFNTQKIKELADGCYAHVYQHPTKSNFVIKIATNSPNYSEYIIWCANNQDNPYVPRLESIEIFDIQTRTHNRNAVVVIMEKLRPVIRTHGHVDQVMNYLSGFQSKNELQNRPKFNKLVEIDLFLKNRPKDIHSGNIMRRGAQPVVTDPIIG